MTDIERAEIGDRAKAERLRNLPRYLFEELASIKWTREKQGADIVDLSIGDPGLGAPTSVVEALKHHAGDPGLHCYTPPGVVEQFNRAAAEWMERRFGVRLDPATEVMPLIGTKEGLAHLPLAVMNPGESAVVTDPSYPVYARAVWFVGGRVDWLPLQEAADFRPDFSLLGDDERRLVFINYPNNPTAAVADLDLYRDAVRAAGHMNAYLVNDAAYSEITFDGFRSPSLLQADGAMARSLEVHSFSKTFNMAGWRIGFAAGNAGLVDALKTLKSNIDSGVFGPVLMAGIVALREGWPGLESTLREYARRRAIIFDCFRDCRIDYYRSPASLYIWAKVPAGYPSLGFARMLLERAGVLVAPGAGFGDCGEGYFRISITSPTRRVEIAADRLRGVAPDWRT